MQLAAHNGLQLLAPAIAIPLQWDPAARSYAFAGTLPLPRMLHAAQTAIVARLLVEYNVHSSSPIAEPKKRGGMRGSLRRKAREWGSHMPALRLGETGDWGLGQRLT